MTDTQRKYMMRQGVPASIQQMDLPPTVKAFAQEGGLVKMIKGEKGLWVHPSHVAALLFAKWYLQQGWEALVIPSWDVVRIIDDEDDLRNPYEVQLLVVTDVQDEQKDSPFGPAELRRLANLIRWRVNNEQSTIVHTHVEHLKWWPDWFQGFVNSKFERFVSRV